MKYIAFILVILCCCSCTSNATRLAISNYETVERRKQEKFDNVLRIANDQMYLNYIQFSRANRGDLEKTEAGLASLWRARQNLEELRVQYAYDRWQTDQTVGRFLYDSQGWANVLFGDISEDASRLGNAINKANDAAGVKNPIDLITPSTTQNSR